MDNYIKNLIETNIHATKAIDDLESAINNIKITTEKDKANFGNLCIILKGYRMVVEGTECLLKNENIIKTDNEEFYAKLDINKNSNKLEPSKNE